MKISSTAIHVGMRVGMWTVLAPAPPRRKYDKVWLCRCDCGSEREVFATSLAADRTHSCGCKTAEFIAQSLVKDLTGKRFGRLTVIRLHKMRGRSLGTEWECLCDCGKTTYPLGDNLSSAKKTTRSCGCLSRETTSARMRTHGQSRTKAYKAYIQRRREAARKHRIPPWADLEAIRNMYVSCPKGMTVDHVIPLRGKLVSGLHVLNNLQYLSRSANSRKRISFEPIFTSCP